MSNRPYAVRCFLTVTLYNDPFGYHWGLRAHRRPEIRFSPSTDRQLVSAVRDIEGKLLKRRSGAYPPFWLAIPAFAVASLAVAAALNAAENWSSRFAPSLSAIAVIGLFAFLRVTVPWFFVVALGGRNRVNRLRIDDLPPSFFTSAPAGRLFVNLVVAVFSAIVSIVVTILFQGQIQSLIHSILG